MDIKLNAYRDEDFFTALHELNRIHTACMKGIEAGSKADFDYWDEFISEIAFAHANLRLLHSKKVEDDLNVAEEKARQMF
ncbi:hypothetical protein [Oceanobacillus oncorhynchi]|uniref:hypothetical protein n=1 Tax=Oceanobacillus oncorhynchi TaxID=545501 RepID=UPI0025A49B31|nr:hypothetical protein [Oceanobacillus oncorhynchi]MDM8100969.1 hypothetical protein [Oceanobacillus oncorhynchi]